MPGASGPSWRAGSAAIPTVAGPSRSSTLRPSRSWTRGCLGSNSVQLSCLGRYQTRWDWWGYGGGIAVLSRVQRVYWDASVFLAYLEGKETLVCEALLSSARKGGIEVLTSVFTLTEVALVEEAKRQQHPD